MLILSRCDAYLIGLGGEHAEIVNQLEIHASISVQDRRGQEARDGRQSGKEAGQTTHKPASLESGLSQRCWVSR